MIEPGISALVRLTISVKTEDEQQLNRLKHRLEADEGKRLSTSEVIRRAIVCFCESKGVQ